MRKDEFVMRSWHCKKCSRVFRVGEHACILNVNVLTEVSRSKCAFIWNCLNIERRASTYTQIQTKKKNKKFNLNTHIEKWEQSGTEYGCLLVGWFVTRVSICSLPTESIAFNARFGTGTKVPHYTQTHVQQLWKNWFQLIWPCLFPQ